MVGIYVAKHIAYNFNYTGNAARQNITGPRKNALKENHEFKHPVSLQTMRQMLQCLRICLSNHQRPRFAGFPPRPVGDTVYKGLLRKKTR